MNNTIQQSIKPFDKKAYIVLTILSVLTIFSSYILLTVHRSELDPSTSISRQITYTITAAVLSVIVLVISWRWPSKEKKLGFNTSGEYRAFIRLLAALISGINLFVCIETFILIGFYWNGAHYSNDFNPNRTFYSWSTGASVFTMALSLISFTWLIRQMANQSSIAQKQQEMLERITHAEHTSINILNTMGYLHDRHMLDSYLHTEYEKHASDENTMIFIQKDDYRVHSWIQNVFTKQRDQDFPRQFIFLGNFKINQKDDSKPSDLRRHIEQITKDLKNLAEPNKSTSKISEYTYNFTLLLLAVGREITENGVFLKTSTAIHLSDNTNKPQFALVANNKLPKQHTLFLLGRPEGSTLSGFIIHKFVDDRVVNFFKKGHINHIIDNINRFRNKRPELIKQIKDIYSKSSNNLVPHILELEKQTVTASVLAYGYIKILHCDSLTPINIIERCCQYATKIGLIDSDESVREYKNRLKDWWFTNDNQ